ncbi:puromycin-sensitive aminopeptidase-like [Planoprotostelium fungivorum]|uniref:Aminopeptidase n=1 Tax=Planoprotostelium fungivorum TaxID=1890364 RepID=A0A2P6N789_9EUKA|nr:puromycin-sensitive aminopeptidase-like [Planoprotostelium fungivorum]
MTADYRLPTHSKPSQYDLLIIPDFVNFTFQGSVDISITITDATQTITLNSSDITYPTSADGKPQISIKGSQGGISADQITLDAESQRATFNFPSSLSPGSYVLSIRYDGIMNDKLAGFYRSKYTKNDGSVSWIGCTQFEATDCRKAVPSWDEPAHKAIFRVQLVVPEGMTALSNMPVVQKRTTLDSSKEADQSRGLQYKAGSVHHTYAETPVMSTYLLAWVIGHFDYISGYTQDHKEVRVYTPLGKSHLGHYALQTSLQCLPFYEKFFEFEYPLPKMDLIAIPDFAAGAMENWGLVTYRETALLIDPQTSSTVTKQRVARTVCHEIAHMWFGNAVTMEWWTYLWLNEGFARFVEHLAVDHIYPEYDIFTQFVTDVYYLALGLDSLRNTHAVEVPVKLAQEVNEIFDTISYAKGGSCLRMLYWNVGAENFRRGLALYVDKYKYKNTVTENLWDSLSEATGRDIKKLMDSWIKQEGYPVVTASEVQGKEGRVLKLSQKRFFADMSDAKAVANESLWSIPISVGAYRDGKLRERFDSVFEAQQGEIVLPSSFSSEDVLKINIEHTGFYRVHYDEPLFQKLLEIVPSLSPIDRLGLQRDTFSLATAGVGSLERALDVMSRLKDENNFSVISALSTTLHQLCSLHSENERVISSLRGFISGLFSSQFGRLGWQAGATEEHQSGMLRGVVLSIIGETQDQAVQEEAMRRLRAFAADEKDSSIAGDLRSTVYSICMRYKTRESRELLLSIYRRTSSAEERVRILGAIGRINTSKEGSTVEEAKRAIQDNLEWWTTDEVRNGDSAYLLGSISSSNLGRQTVWNHLTSDWKAFSARFGDGQNFVLSSVLSGVLVGHSTLVAAEDFEKWFEENPMPAAKRTISQLSETVRLKAGRLERESRELEKWLTEKNY